jgi:uncharacterized protein involved in outer membrane biogenesis
MALYAALGFVGVPLLARHYVARGLSELTGRVVMIEDMGFNPFTLAAEVRGTKIMASDGTTLALSFDALKINFELESFVRGGLVLHEVALDGPRFKLTRLADGEYDWDDVLARLPRPASERKGKGAARFSLANIHIGDGLIEIDDRVTGLQHRLDQIEIGLPFLSNLAVEVDVFVEPALQARLNGKTLGMSAKMKPFSATQTAQLDFSIKAFELAPWMAYWPFKPGFSVSSGTLDLDLNLDFSQGKTEAPSVHLQGTAQINHLALHDQTDRPVLNVAELELELADVQPLGGRFHFSKLRLLHPELELTRQADGSFDWARLWPSGKTSAKAEETRAAAKPDFLLASARIRDGVIRYNDHAVGFTTKVEAINLDLRDLATTGELPAEIHLDYVTDAGEKFSHQDHLYLAPFKYEGSLAIEGGLPARYAPYYAAFLPGGEVRGGRLDGTLHYRFGEQTEFGGESLALSDFIFGLTGRKNAALTLNRLGVSTFTVTPGSNSVQVGEVVAEGWAMNLSRLRNGRLDFMSAISTPSARKTAPTSPWKVKVEKLAASGGALRFEDKGMSANRSAIWVADGLEFQANNPSTVAGEKTGFTLKGGLNGGRVGLNGTLATGPLQLELKFETQSLDLSVAQAYVEEQARLDIKAGKLSASGQLALRQRGKNMQGTVRGELTVNDFVSGDRINGTDFVRWKEVAFKNARVDFSPFALDIDQIGIDGLRSRLILDQEGRLNLREIQRLPEEEAVSPAENTPASTTASSALRIGRISLKDGNILFSDRFVRPNYNANLNGLSGELSGLSSAQESLAKLNLRGRVGRTAPLTIKGEFNPFRDDRHLGIEASVKDFELTGLSGYAGRYVGYGISRGKLSATLDYRIEDRKLSANNHIFLDQLTFGDAVDSPDALDLPILLAVALLKNSRGEIELDLPVSGTLDDPEFSVFGLVLRAFAGLIGKAITAPFTLLGREELSWVEFEPGSARVGAQQVEQLHALATTLIERPALKLDLTGLASMKDDAEGIRLDKLRNQVRALGRKSGNGDGGLAGREIEPGNARYAELLGEIYDGADIDDKPRNFLGFARSLPVAEMEALLLKHTPVTDDDISALARRRENAVRRWLSDEGEVDAVRIFQRSLSTSEVEHGEREGHGVRFFLR